MKKILKSNRDGSEQILLGNVIMKERPSRKRARRLEWSFSLETMRLREIEAIIRHRHGNGIPDPCGSDDVETCQAYLRAVAFTPNVQDLASWALVWAPWATDDVIEAIAARRSRRKRMIGAEAVARLLFVTLAERTALGLRTIGACDVSIEDRRQLAVVEKRTRDRARQEQKRRAAGRIPRDSYEAASVSRLKPWLAEGISRAAWYRRRETSPSRIEVIGNSDTPVSEPDLPATVQQVHSRSRVAGSVVGLGDHPPAELQEAVPHGNSDVIGGQAA